MVRTWSDFGIGRLFDISRDPVILVDDHGQVVLWNRAATALFGYSAREAVGMNVDRLVPPEHVHQHHAGIERYRRTGRGAIVDSHKALEVPALRKDGQRIWIELALSPLERRGRRYALGIARDVTERVRMRERQAEARKELEEANRMLEAFAHVVGHDLKEPVRGIGAYLEALGEETDPHERARLLQRAREAHGDLERFLSGLLEWSRTAATPLEPAPLPLADVLRDPSCAAQWSLLARERGARVEIDPALPTVQGTESLVCRVFGNLVTNAIRHNPRQRPTVRIRPGEGEEPHIVEVWVEDDGPGFPPELIDALAQEPRTLRRGFGLAIARLAAERLHGEIRAENTPRGGRMRVRLPAPPDPERASGAIGVRELV